MTLDETVLNLQKRLKWTQLMTVICFALSALGIFLPNGRSLKPSDDGSASTITASSFVLLGTDGSERGKWTTEEYGSKFSMQGPDGKASVIVVVSQNSSELMLNGHEGAQVFASASEIGQTAISARSKSKFLAGATDLAGLKLEPFNIVGLSTSGSGAEIEFRQTDWPLSASDALLEMKKQGATDEAKKEALESINRIGWGGLVQVGFRTEGESQNSAKARTYFALSDTNRRIRTITTVNEEGASLSLIDKEDAIRATLGATSLVNKESGEVTMRPEASLVLFKIDNTVSWLAPQ